MLLQLGTTLIVVEKHLQSLTRRKPAIWNLRKRFTNSYDVTNERS